MWKLAPPALGIALCAACALAAWYGRAPAAERQRWLAIHDAEVAAPIEMRMESRPAISRSRLASISTPQPARAELPPVPIEVDAKEPTVRLRGTVIDANGDPVGEARVAAIRLADGKRAPRGAWGVLSETPSGDFSIAGLTRGWWSIRVVAEGFARREALVEIAESELELPLVLAPAHDLSGVITSAGGAPVANAHVVARGRGASALATATREDGSFHLAAVMNPCHLEVRRRPFVTWRANAIDPDGGPLRIELEPGYELDGFVVDAANDAPIAGAEISAFDADGERVRIARSRADGSFTLDCLPAGAHEMRISAADYLSKAGSVVVPAAEDPLFHRLRRGAAYGARFLGPEGNALGGVHVCLEGIDLESSAGAARFLRATRSDAAGACLLTGLPEGVYALLASHREHATLRAEIRIARGAASETEQLWILARAIRE